MISPEDAGDRVQFYPQNWGQKAAMLTHSPHTSHALLQKHTNQYDKVIMSPVPCSDFTWLFHKKLIPREVGQFSVARHIAVMAV